MENRNSVVNVMNSALVLQHPTLAYHRVLSRIRDHDKNSALELLKHLKEGRNKRAIQHIDRELKKSPNSLPLRELKKLIVDMTEQNTHRVNDVKYISQNVKNLKNLKSTQGKLIRQKNIRRDLKRKYNSDISRLNSQLAYIDHKKHNKKKKQEISEIPTRFRNIQIGGRIKKVVSTTRKIISHYELNFLPENYEFDYSEARTKALIQLLNKSIHERVEFYQQEINEAIIHHHHHGIKVQERLLCLFEKIDVAQQEPATGFLIPKEDSPFCKMLDHMFLPSSNILQTITATTHTFCEAVAEAEMNQSGYVFKTLKTMLIDVFMYNAPSGSNYISLPKEIENRQSTTNIQNKDNECFKYSLYCHFEKNDLPYEYQGRKRTNPPNKNIKQNPCRVSNYNKLNYLDFSEIPFPVPLEDTIISKIEEKNNLSINIYSLEEQEEDDKCYYKCVPERITKTFSYDDRHINLLYLTDDDKGHYVYISKYDNLCKKRNSNTQVYVCRKCCCLFYKKEKLEEHYEKYDCQSQGVLGFNFVEEKDKWLTFTNHNNKFFSPFVIYADFECLLTKKENDK